MSAFDAAALLARHRPVVQYDSLESYPADWAAVITDHPGNMLKRADGTVLAVAGPSVERVPTLEITFLQPTTYPTGEPVLPTDYVDETGKGYVQAAREMHSRTGYADMVHGRVTEQAGVTWLQYWFFMYYDDPGFLGLGTHEGDIEMIQLRLNDTGEPESVSYSQHRSGLRAAWDQVDTDGAAPVVYSARGSHASMLRSGTQRSHRALSSDHNDGKGRRVKPDLIPLLAGQTPWALWPGHWGSTQPDTEILGKVGVEALSPGSLASHRAWRDPAGFHQSCDESDLPAHGAPHAAGTAVPPAPDLEVRLDQARSVANIRYRLPDTAAPPANLVIGVDSSGGKLPPATTSVRAPDREGEFEAPLHPGATNVQIHASTQSDEGGVSETVSASPDNTPA